MLTLEVPFGHPTPSRPSRGNENRVSKTVLADIRRLQPEWDFNSKYAHRLSSGQGFNCQSRRLAIELTFFNLLQSRVKHTSLSNKLNAIEV